MGYNGNPPATGASIHLAPLMHSSWTQAIESKKLEDKPVRELTELIKEEGKLRMPVHQRRLQLLKAKRNQTKHTEFIFQLEKLMSVAEFEKMTSDKMILHLFAETADSIMSRLALEILSAVDLKVADLRTRVTEVENAIWYKRHQGMGKVACVNTVEKHCETCKGKWHNTEDCWGKWEHCQKFGHKTELCRNNPNNLNGNKGLANTAAIVKKKKGGKKKKKEKRKNSSRQNS
jgi:hypothetical protein